MKLYTIHAGNFKLDGGAMFGVVPKSIWNKIYPADNNNMCTWALRCLLIEVGDRRILVDTGMGNKQNEKFFSHYYIDDSHTLLGSLNDAGFSATDITDVLHTHLHFDHCGGSISKQGEELVYTFDKATYWSNKKHFDWAVNPNDREKASFLKENILPMEQGDRLQFIDTTEGVTFLHNDISIKFAYGHTEAMMLPAIQYKGSTLVFMADLLPSTAHLPIPYVMSYDMFPMKTLQEKKQFLQEAALNQYILFFEHDAQVECCTVKMTEKGVRVHETFTLKDI